MVSASSVASVHVLPRMAAGASITDATAFTASPAHFPVTGVAAVMTSPEWLAAGSDAEAEEHMNELEEQKPEMQGEHLKNSEGAAAGEVAAPKLMRPYLSETVLKGEDAAMMAGLEAITGGIQELLRKAGLLKTDDGARVRDQLAQLHLLAGERKKATERASQPTVHTKATNLVVGPRHGGDPYRGVIPGEVAEVCPTVAEQTSNSQTP